MLSKLFCYKGLFKWAQIHVIHVTNAFIVQMAKSKSNVSLEEGFDNNVIEIVLKRSFKTGKVVAMR